MDNPAFSVISDNDTHEKDVRVKEEEKNEKGDARVAPKISGLLYTVEEIPPLSVIVISAFQVVFSSLGGPLSQAFLIYLAVCPGGNSDVLVKLISTSLIFVGLTTFLQVTLGLRLPVLQGSSPVFLVPILLMMQTSRWRCPTLPSGNGTYLNGNFTDDPQDQQPWRPRIAEISGSLAVASCTQVFLGATGLIGILVRFIGPLTVTPLLALVALSLARVIVIVATPQWGIALLTAFLTVIFNVCLAKVQIPCLSWKRKRGFHLIRIQIFRVFANIFAICISWVLCHILTVTNVFPNDSAKPSYNARTDVKLDALGQAPWVFFPYPGQWGPLTVSAPTTIGMLGAVIASILESLGDYRVTAFACRVPPPPKHAINRAVMMEGIGSVLSGAFGACHATTTYSEIIGYINYTGVASRLTWQIAAVIYFVAGVVGKVGGVLALVPDPIIGGMEIIGAGMVFSTAIAALRNVNLELPRNLMVLGVSIMVGASVPIFIQQNPEALASDKTGVMEVLLTNSPLLGGICGFLLDNILPGSRKDRGFVKTFEPDIKETETQMEKEQMEKGTAGASGETKGMKTGGLEVYEFNSPCCRNISWPGFLRYVPFSPLYRNDMFSNCCKKCKRV